MSDISEKTEPVLRQERMSCTIEIEGRKFSFWRYGGNDGLRANIMGAQEVYFGSDEDVRRLVAALDWSLAHKDQIPDLVRVRGRGTGRVLYGLRRDEAEKAVREGRAYWQGEDIVGSP